MRFRRQRDAALDALLVELRSERRTPGARILRALRFVQDDIRYTGLEIGAGAWHPRRRRLSWRAATATARTRRCCWSTLLRALGVEAYPALVNSEVGRGVARRAPNPGAFNHAIAKVRWKRTRLLAGCHGQRAGWQARYDWCRRTSAPRWCWRPQHDGLEDIPPRAMARRPSSFVVETYDFRAGHQPHRGVQGPARCIATRRPTRMRVTARTETAAELGKELPRLLPQEHIAASALRLRRR